MNNLLSAFIGGIIGLIFAINTLNKDGYTTNSDISLKLKRTLDSSILDCISQDIITKEQVNTMKIIFYKHIEDNFEYSKIYFKGEP